MTKKLKLSPWHDGSVKPVHVGVYEVQVCCNDYIYHSYFDGIGFRGGWEGHLRALEQYKNYQYYEEFKQWRGVLK